MNTEPVTHITTEVMDGTGKVLTVTCADDTGTPVAPDTMTWSLYNSANEIVDSRESVSVASPATSNTILISGTANSLLVDPDRYRLFIVEWTYTSDAGSGIPAGDMADYYIVDKTRG